MQAPVTQIDLHGVLKYLDTDLRPAIQRALDVHLPPGVPIDVDAIYSTLLRITCRPSLRFIGIPSRAVRVRRCR